MVRMPAKAAQSDIKVRGTNAPIRENACPGIFPAAAAESMA